MSKNASRPAGLLVALAACCWLAGCAGLAERLPECKGKSVPINPFVPTAKASGRSINPTAGSTARVSESNAH